jgi:hypothetical protein
MPAAAAVTLTRCPVKGCPVRFRGPGRDCGGHRLDEPDRGLAAALATPPGGRLPRHVRSRMPPRVTARGMATDAAERHQGASPGDGG